MHATKKTSTTLRGFFGMGEDVPWFGVGSALALGIIAFIANLLLVLPRASPGEPARLMAIATGIRPLLSAQHTVWNGLVALVDSLGAEGAVYRVNMLSAFFGAIAAGLVCMVVVRFFTLIVDVDQVGRLPASQRSTAVRHASGAILLGGVTASLALTFCIPFWIVSTQSYYHTFYVAWLLLSILSMLQYLRTSRFHWVILFAFLHGAGMSQASAFIAFAPLLALALLYLMWLNNRLHLGTIVPIVLAVSLGYSLVLLNAAVFYYSEGFELLSFGGYPQVVKELSLALIRGAAGNLPRNGWLIIIGLSIAPWLAALISGKRALNGERDWSIIGLHLAIAIVNVAVLVNIKASPWNFFGAGNVTIIPYLLSAMTFGYLATFAYLMPAHLWAAADQPMKKIVRNVTQKTTMILLLAFVLVTGFLNVRHVDFRNASFIDLYVDRLLDCLQGRTWLVTNGALDDIILLRAKERGIDLNCINLTEANNKTAIRAVKLKLKNVRLKNSADLGYVSLLQEWIAEDPEGGKELALTLFPDLWGLGDYQMLPNGLVFLGVPKEEIQNLDLNATIERHETLWNEMESAIQSVPDTASERVLLYRDRIVRAQTSFVGNNLGFMLEGLGKTNEAFRVYDRIHHFDRENVSALLNWAAMIYGGRSPDLKESVAADLNALNRKLDGSQLPIWSLSRVYGYVSQPESFAQLGWSWAASGQARLAINALKQAEETVPEQHRVAIKGRMAHINLLRDNPGESETLFLQMLADDANNFDALLGLTRIYTMRGDTDRAREFLGRAEKAGVPRATLMRTTALVAQAEGKLTVAHAILQEQIDLDPSNIMAMAQLCTLLMEENNVDAMITAVGKLEDAAGADAYQTLIARASLATMQNDQTAARNFYIKAHKLQPSAVALLERILKMDFAMGDKSAGEEHARQILRLNSNHSFGNYILGSLASEQRKYDSAEAYLRRSVEGEQTLANLNDLAMVLIHRDELEEAEQRVREAIAIDEEVGALWDTLGVLQARKNLLEEAEKSLRMAVKLDAEDLRIHVHLADVLFRRNDIGQASEIIRAVAKDTSPLPREDMEKFEELYQKILGVKYTRKK